MVQSVGLSRVGARSCRENRPYEYVAGLYSLCDRPHSESTALARGSCARRGRGATGTRGREARCVVEALFEIPCEGPLTRSVHSFNHKHTALRLHSHHSQPAVLERVHTVRQVYSVLRRERSSPETRQATDAGAHAFPARRQRARTRSVATSHTQESAACDGRPSRRTEDAARAV